MTRYTETPADLGGHTPGPWFVGDDDEDAAGVEYIDVHAGAYMDSPYRSIAHVQPGFDEDFLPRSDEDWANARLIAAAPELLDALKALQLQALQSPDLLATEWGQEALSLTKAALNKATGQ